MMQSEVKKALEEALAERQINKAAFDEMVRWLTDEEFEEFVPDLQKKIEERDWKFLMDAFYRLLVFGGTGGVRGSMAIGTNRMNNHIIRRASQAYAAYLHAYKADIVDRGVAIAYDTRHNSKTFAQETARVLAANGIPVKMYDYYRATPQLSFTVRRLECAGGIVITASHNPPEFNGYKIYDENGVQLLPDEGFKIAEEFDKANDIKKMDFEEALSRGLVSYISKDLDREFIEQAKKVSVYDGRGIKIAYSPLHGVGTQSVLPVLKELGFDDVDVVDEQMSLDGEFPNVHNHFPNPEFPAVYEETIQLAKQKGADLGLVSDPDADRLGIAVPDKDGTWHVLSGNQAAVFMAFFYLSRLKEAGAMPKKPVIIKTSLTTELLRDVAESFGAEVIGDLLVGFKYIGDRAEHLPADKTFLFGCEETTGYVFGNSYRDKGADSAALIAAEATTWAKEKGKTPIDVLEDIYRQYGFYADRVYYKLIEGLGTFEQMNMAMAKLRGNLPTEIAGRKVLKALDRLTGQVRDGQSGELLETRDWDKGDMLSFFFTNDERIAVHVRPSGTEPKMKYYSIVKGDLKEKTKEEVGLEAREFEESIVAIFDEILSSIKVDVFQDE
ncbi:MAG: phospho-sugar mutase [Candidatus Spechtbacterales bacterium]